MWGYSRSGSDLVDIVSRSIEGGTVMHGCEGGCLIMVYEEQYDNYGDIEKIPLLLAPDQTRYSSQLSSSNYNDGRGTQGFILEVRRGARCPLYPPSTTSSPCTNSGGGALFRFR